MCGDPAERRPDCSPGASVRTAPHAKRGRGAFSEFLRAQTHGVRPGLRRGLVEVKLFWNATRQAFDRSVSNSWRRQARWLVR